MPQNQSWDCGDSRFEMFPDEQQTLTEHFCGGITHKKQRLEID